MNRPWGKQGRGHDQDGGCRKAFHLSESRASKREYQLHFSPPFTRLRVGDRFLHRRHQLLPFAITRITRLVAREVALGIEFVRRLHEHEVLAAELEDKHPLDADGLESALDLRPNRAMMLEVAIVDLRIVLQVDRAAVLFHQNASTPPSIGYACPVMNEASSEHK